MRRVRVVHAIHSLEPGGAEAVLVELGRVAASVGIDMAVMPLMRIRNSAIADQLAEVGVEVLPVDRPNRWDLRAFTRAGMVLRRWGPDVVHTHLKHADLVGGAIARRRGVPWVSTLHVVEEVSGLGARAKRGSAAALRQRFAARTITVSEAQRRWYLATCPGADTSRVVMIHNGVADPHVEGSDRRRALRAEFGVRDDVCVFLQLGLLRPGKGHDTLLEALRLLGPGPRVQVLVAGDGELRDQLEHAAADVSDRVTFLGYRLDVPDLLAAADAVVQPSEFDALPTAVIQGLAAGRPVVASRVGGIPEIVTPAEGVLIPARSPSALAGALKDVAGDPAMRGVLGDAARARYERRFTADQMARELRALYDEVLVERGRS